jgi:hypothetical protein
MPARRRTIKPIQRNTDLGKGTIRGFPHHEFDGSEHDAITNGWTLRAIPRQELRYRAQPLGARETDAVKIREHADLKVPAEGKADETVPALDTPTVTGQRAGVTRHLCLRLLRHGHSFARLNGASVRADRDRCLTQSAASRALQSLTPTRR